MAQRLVFSNNGISKWCGLVTFLAIGLMAILMNCSDSSTSPPKARNWYYEHEFSQNPGLNARPEQVVILELAPGVGAMEHAIPYEFQEGGSYLFGIEADDPFIVRGELYDSNGVPVLSFERGDGGAYLDVPAGTYTLKVVHDGSNASPGGTAAFVRLQQTGAYEATREATRIEAGETGFSIQPQYPAYVALRSSSSPTRYLGLGEITVSGELVHSVAFCLYPPDQIPGHDYLFSFEPMTAVDCTEAGVYPPFEGTYRLHLWQHEEHRFTTTTADCDILEPKCPSNQTVNLPAPHTISFPAMFAESSENFVHVEAKDSGFFSLWSFIWSELPCSPIYADPDNMYVYWTEFQKPPGNPAGQWQIDQNFTFYADGSQIDQSTLQKGQVAIYGGNNFTGAAAILRTSFDVTYLICLSTIGSVAFGPLSDTTVQFYSEENYQGQPKTVGVNTSSISDLTDVKSIKLFDSKKMLIGSDGCPFCNLEGVDLSGLSLEKADLSYANLMGANLTNANLEGASLYNASLQGNTDANRPAASLVGAYLKNANLAGADLGGADFTNASFHTDLPNESGCAQDPNNPGYTLNCSSAAGATISLATFTNAYLAGTDFSNTSATATDFTGAVLFGANFTNAQLDWDSSTSVSTKFIGALIQGADFSNATVEGANFQNAYVDMTAGGQCIVYKLSQEHTQFPGFDKNMYTDSPCAMFTYTEATTTPATDATNTCPDGSKPVSGSCSEDAWTNPVSPLSNWVARHCCGDTTSCQCSEDHIDYLW